MDVTLTFKILVLLVLKAGHQLQLEAEETRRTCFCATKNATIQNSSQIWQSSCRSDVSGSVQVFQCKRLRLGFLKAVYWPVIDTERLWNSLLLCTKQNDLKQTVKPHVNGRNVVGCYILRPFAHPVACCCALLGEVAQSLKPVKLLAACKRTQQLPILSDQQCWELLCQFVRRFNLISKKRAKTVASWPSDRTLILLN